MAGNHRKPFAVWAFVAFLEQDLKTNTHREGWRASTHPVGDRIRKAGGTEPRQRRPKRADARQHDAFGPLDHGRVQGDPGRGAEPGKSREHRGEIGRPGRQDHHLGAAHRLPLVLGTWSGPSSRTA